LDSIVAATGLHRLQDMSYKGFAFTLMARERANQ